MQLTFSVYRYNPDVDNAPRMQDYKLEVEEGQDMMVLDALIALKEQDPTLSFRLIFKLLAVVLFKAVPEALITIEFAAWLVSPA